MHNNADMSGENGDHWNKLTVMVNHCLQTTTLWREVKRNKRVCSKSQLVPKTLPQDRKSRIFVYDSPTNSNRPALFRGNVKTLVVQSFCSDKALI